MSIADNMDVTQPVIPTSQGAQGPYYESGGGWLDGLAAAHQDRADYTVERAMQEKEADQVPLAASVGVTLTPILPVETNQAAFGLATGTYQAVPGRSDAIAHNDKTLADLKTKYPNLPFKTYADMGAEIRSDIATSDNLRSRATYSPGGRIAAFAGGAAGDFDPRYNSPWTGIAAAGLGAVAGAAAPEVLGGATLAGAAARVGLNDVLQTGFDAASRWSGNDKERQFLGQPVESLGRRVTGELASNTVAGVGGEILGWGVRMLGRFLRNGTPDLPSAPEAPSAPASEPPAAAPSSPVPPGYPGGGPTVAGPAIPPEGDLILNKMYAEQPYGPAREAVAKVNEDLSAFTTQADDINGPPLNDIPQQVSDRYIGTPEARSQAVRDGLTVDDIAARVDPETIREFRDLDQEMTDTRSRIADMQGQQFDPTLDGEIAAQRQTVDQIDEQIAQLGEQRAAASRTDAQRLQERADELIQQREALASGGARRTSAEQAAQRDADVQALRARLISLDERKRDLAPLVTRAYRIAEDTRSRAPVKPDAPDREQFARETQETVEREADQGLRMAAPEKPAESAPRAEETQAGEAASTPPAHENPAPGIETAEEGYRLPDGRVIRSDALVEIPTDDGGTRLGSVDELMQHVREWNALDEASRICAI